MNPAVTLLAALAIGPAADPPTPADGYIAGRVVDLQGRPIKDARVGFHCPVASAEPQVTTTTGEEGKFKLGPLPPGTNYGSAKLFADATGFCREYVCAPPILPGATATTDDIFMTQGHEYTGRVLTDMGIPIPNARVRAETLTWYHRDGVGPHGRSIDVFTDAEGKYRLPPLPAGTVSLTFFASERQRDSRWLKVEPGKPGTVTDTYLEPGVTYRGRVVDEDGKPVAGALIDTNEMRGVRITSGEDGRFVLVGYGPKWPPRALVTKDGFQLDQFGGGKGEVEVKLLRFGWFAGKVIDADTGAAVRLDDARISFPPNPNPKALPGPWPSSIPTPLEQPEPGRFRVGFPSPQEYTITLFAKGYEPAKFKVTATERKTVDVPDVKMKKASEPPKPKPEVPGTATLGGKPLKGGWAVLYRVPEQLRGADLMRMRPVVGQRVVYAAGEVIDGKFSLVVPQDKLTDWFVAVHAPDRPPGIVGPIALPGGKPAAVAVEIPEAGSLSGTVGDIPGQLDGYLWVVAFAKNGYRAEARVRPGGKFTFPALPPGEYGLKVGHELFQDADVEAERPMPPVFKLQPADPWKRATLVTVKPGQAAVKDLTVPER